MEVLNDAFVWCSALLLLIEGAVFGAICFYSKFTAVVGVFTWAYLIIQTHGICCSLVPVVLARYVDGVGGTQVYPNDIATCPELNPTFSSICLESVNTRTERQSVCVVNCLFVFSVQRSLTPFGTSTRRLCVFNCAAHFWSCGQGFGVRCQERIALVAKMAAANCGWLPLQNTGSEFSKSPDF